MAGPFSSEQEPVHRKMCSLFLAFSWIAGLLCGAFLFLSVEDSSFLWMRRLPERSVSIVSSLCVTLFPILISVFAVSLRAIFFLYPLCFLKALQFSFVSCGIVCAFGDAGWLIRWLMLCSEILLLPVLYGYWLQCTARRKQNAVPVSILILMAAVVRWWTDTQFIMPLVGNIMEAFL